MDEQNIINSIDRIVGSNYSDWYIGITDDTERRRREHGNPANWYDWRADTEQIARYVEKHFLDKGMNGDAGGGSTPNYVYIYRE